MGKSVMTIHKEIEKKKYAESPIGKAERALGDIYNDLMKKGEKLPEDIAKRISDIRDGNEKWNMDFIETTVAEDRARAVERRDLVDKKLLEAFTTELEILNANGYGIQS